MPALRNIKNILQLSACFARHPRPACSLLGSLPATVRGFGFAEGWQATAKPTHPDRTASREPNPLSEYFHSHTEGKGIWKWDHYFHVYHNHFSRFIGHQLRVLEVGVLSGGSLEMWRSYFGSNCSVYGVDIDPACKTYENEYTKIFIGDQADRHFWRELKLKVPPIDILIDDGGHQAQQQIVTLEEMLPHIRPGGIYLCEDVHGVRNGLAAYVQGLAGSLNRMIPYSERRSDINHRTPFQTSIDSIHFYPFIILIEIAADRAEDFIALKQGSEWRSP